MKKSLFTLLALAPLAWASAASLGPKALPAMPSDTYTPLGIEATGFTSNHHSSRAAELSMEYMPAIPSEYMGALGFNNSYAGQETAMAFQLTGEALEDFAGTQLTAVNFYTGGNGKTQQNQIHSVTVSLTKELEEAPFYTQTSQFETTKIYDFVSIPMDEPYTVEADSAFYVCVTFALTSAQDYCVVVDGIYHGGAIEGGWVGVKSGEDWIWDNLASSYGFVCVGATFSGDAVPQNRLDVVDYAAPSVAYQNENFEFGMLLQNNGANDVTSFDVTYTVGDLAPVTETLTLTKPLGYLDTYTIWADDLKYPNASANAIDVVMNISKVNEVENSSRYPSATSSILILPEGKGYQKNVVIEEITGTWCGNCPLGYSTMEEIHENYPDGGLIPVAVHVSSGTGTEPMQSTTYAQVGNMVSGVPAALLNRQEQVYPFPYSDVIEAYEAMAAIPAVGKIDLNVDFIEGEARKLQYTATTEFIFDFDDADQRYAIAFGLTEDNLGPYNQVNYFTNQGEGFGGWENQPNPVSLIYNDVARQLNTYTGIANSIPASVKAETPYTFEYVATVSSKVKLENCNVVAYLMDLKTGVIENATTVKAGNFGGSTGVSEVTVDANAPVEYFNLQGMRVQNPSTGVYIRRQGSEVTKVLVP